MRLVIFRLQRCGGFPDQPLDGHVVIMRRIGPAELDDHEAV
jgi:hypothetical protein